jgi:hypothetical protein
MHNRLERYLDKVSRPMPVREREEWRMEVEQHLASIIAAYEELGHSHEEATELALTRFGEAAQLGLQMQAESSKSFPLALKGVTALFAMQGLMCWYLSLPRFLRHGGQNEALLVWGVPALFIAAGLLRRSPFWRKAAVTSVCTTLFFSILFTLGMPEHWVRGEPPFLACFRILAYVVAPAWQLWVLTRPNVTAVFKNAKPRWPRWAKR